MSVSPSAGCASPALCGSEGELVSVRVSVEPRLLERLLEALAELDFPINPQIYHDAAAVFVYADGRNVVQPVTLVEFPAYQNRLPGVREAVTHVGFDPACVKSRSMLDDLHSEFDVEPASPGSPYARIVRYRQRPRHAVA
jgi:hypothetical protein